MKRIKRTPENGGFTLLEMLLVVAIIAILAGIVIVAINPSRQLGKTRDAQRESDISAIYSALQQYYVDHGSYPSAISSQINLGIKEICWTTTATTTSSNPGCVNTIDLSSLVPTYLQAIPNDPLTATTSSGTGYYVGTASVNGTTATSTYIEALRTEYSPHGDKKDAYVGLPPSGYPVNTSSGQ